MKIYFVTNLRLPNERGVSYGVISMCKALAETGNDVELVAPKCRPVMSIKDDIWKYHNIDKKAFSFIRLPHLELPEGTPLEFIFSHIRHSMMSWSFSITTLVYLYKHQAKVLHVFNDAREFLFLLQLVKYFYHPVVVFELHILPIGWYDQGLERLSLNIARLLLVTTNRFKRFYEERNFSKSKIMVFPNGVDLESFDYSTPKKVLRKELGLPDDSFVIGYGGRFVTMGMEKGIPELISAVSKLRKKYKNILLVCVGGPQDYVEKYRKKSNKDIFVGDVPQNILYKYLRAFDICAMPFPWTQHYAYNMSPLKMFEYMAAGRPIIASNLPSIREVLRDGDNALLVKPGDSADLATKIEVLYKNRSLANRLAAAAFKGVKTKYQWGNRAAKEIFYLENTK